MADDDDLEATELIPDIRDALFAIARVLVVKGLVDQAAVDEYVEQLRQIKAKNSTLVFCWAVLLNDKINEGIENGSMSLLDDEGLSWN